VIRRFISQQLSYANIMATLALVVALGGGAYAISQLPKNSVGSKQVKDNSLRAKDFKAGQVPAGVQGPQGPQGVQGPPGTPGTNGAPGPNLLLAGRKDFAQQAMADGCGAAYVSTDPFTVTKASTLWAAGAGSYVATGAGIGQPHQPSMYVALVNTSDLVLASTQTTLETRSDAASMHSEGWVTDNSGLFTLQPGTTYKLALLFSANGVCSGAGYLDAPTISWAAYPTPG